jgi:hypothetical protein
MSAGYRCAVCGARVAIETPWPWRCPRATATDRHHVLRIEPTPGAATDFHLNPFVADRQRMAWYRFALAHGYDDASAVSLVEEIDEAVRDVDGIGFAATMVGPSPGLSDALGLDIWVKDETGNVAGSHKARHLMSILLHLLAAERAGVAPPARCGRGWPSPRVATPHWRRRPSRRPPIGRSTCTSRRTPTR